MGYVVYMHFHIPIPICSGFEFNFIVIFINSNRIRLLKLVLTALDYARWGRELRLHGLHDIILYLFGIILNNTLRVGLQVIICCSAGMASL